MSRPFHNHYPHSYEDIIHLPHHVSATHPHMPLADRAAQFSPFAALTGHHEAIKETERITTEKIELDENAKSILDQKLQAVLENSANPQEIKMTYFVPDSNKAGGSYVDFSGIVKRIDPYQRILIMQEGLSVPIDDIIDLKGNF